jgi:hypothetical protein
MEDQAFNYFVKTQQKGMLKFETLPSGTYFAMGVTAHAPAGQAFYFTWDNGTCLIPILDKDNKIIVFPEKAGTSIE